MLFDSGSGVGDLERNFIFGSPEAARLLGQSYDWFCDGTFKVVPEVFYQRYTVHAKIGTNIFPCIYALLPNKTQATYVRVLREISNITNAASPNKMDFEKAAMSAFEQEHPNGTLTDLGLQQRYQNDAQFSIHVLMIMALTFVPLVDVEPAVDDLSTEIRTNLNNDMEELLNYFEETYIGRLRRNGHRGGPTFVHDGTWEQGTSYLERIIMLKFGINACHPNFWKFLHVSEENLTSVKITQYLGGYPDVPQKKQYVDCNIQIANIVQNYPGLLTLGYLRCIAHNLLQ